MNFGSRPACVVARPKLTGAGEHVGVQLPDGSVVHRTQWGCERVSFAQFAAGLHVRELCRAKSTETPSILERVAANVGRPLPYHPTRDNCEHFAYWLIGKERQSPQASGLFFLGFAALAAFSFS